jgi:predicted O-linked N-acetylglucosamine transferase (SPINDLY family)
MRLLNAVPESVLWLSRPSEAAMTNLVREADQRGVAANRLVFAPYAARDEDHLARLRLADLFLDTLPYNAHATASDALWAGVPVLTCLGATFPGRVGASLLSAAGLSELVAGSLAAYETLALKLARDAAALGAVRATLARNRLTHPLFDTARFTHNLEMAFTTMCQTYRNGKAPAGFAVGADA